MWLAIKSSLSYNNPTACRLMPIAESSTDGRNHWPVVMSLAGGGFRHGQVIGATEKDGGHIKDRPVTPGDLAATIYHHMGVPLDTTYLDHNQRPRFVVEDGKPIGELI